MTRFGVFHCVVLLAFWLGSLAAFLAGGMRWLGWVLEVFLWASFVWFARRVYLEFKNDLIEEYEKNKAFTEWGKRQNRRME